MWCLALFSPQPLQGPRALLLDLPSQEYWGLCSLEPQLEGNCPYTPPDYVDSWVLVGTECMLQGAPSFIIQYPVPMGQSALAWPVLLTLSPLTTHHPEGFNPLFLHLSTRST